MDLSNNNRPYYHNTIGTSNTTSSTELFTCFTSRLSSSPSMKISKSILSPARSRDQPMSLSTSLSRRLRTNGSLKGGQASPIFSATAATGGGKKRGCGFENPEPSSPKVTCIGQVRVKTKKKAKQTRSLSRRRSAGDVSSRRLTEQGSGAGERFGLDCKEKGVLGNVSSHYARANSSSHQQFSNQNQQDCLPHRNQRWVHLPLTICEALRAFGAEFSCLLPCSSSCFSTSERGKIEKRNDSREGDNVGDAHGQSSCGDLFARWLVTLQDGGGKEREIELVVGEDEERSEDNLEMRSSRRHVLEDFKINDEIFDGKGGVEEEGRMSICIPPKNALLLMRCKSDPMKMAALTNRFWERPPPQEEEEEEEEEQEGEAFDCKVAIFGDEVVKEIEVDVHKCEAPEEVNEMVVEIENPDSIEVKEVSNLPMEVQGEGEEEEEEEEGMKQEAELNLSEFLDKEEELTFMEALEDHIKNTEGEDANQIAEKEEEIEGCRISCASFSSAINQVEEDGEAEEEAADAETESNSEKDSTFNTEPELQLQTEDLRNTHEDEEIKDQEMETSELKIEKEAENEEVIERRDQFMVEGNSETVENVSSLVSSSPKPSVLPDCLLLMMYEPKLSMEVSKETWVCSRDFSRWLPQRHKHVKQPPPATAAKLDETSIVPISDETKKRTSTDSKSSGNKKSQSPHQAKQAAVAAEPPLAPPTALLPPRSSCSYPVAAVSMAAMIEQKLVNAVGYEPFGLTRCKSEPMRTAGKLAAAQDGCFWTKRKLEPLRRAAFHIGAAGVGF